MATINKEYFLCLSIFLEIRVKTDYFNATHVSMSLLELFLPQGPFPPPYPAFHDYFKPHWSLHFVLLWDFLCVSHYLVLQFYWTNIYFLCTWLCARFQRWYKDKKNSQCCFQRNFNLIRNLVLINSYNKTQQNKKHGTSKTMHKESSG